FWTRRSRSPVWRRSLPTTRPSPPRPKPPTSSVTTNVSRMPARVLATSGSRGRMISSTPRTSPSFQSVLGLPVASAVVARQSEGGGGGGVVRVKAGGVQAIGDGITNYGMPLIRLQPRKGPIRRLAQVGQRFDFEVVPGAAPVLFLVFAKRKVAVQANLRAAAPA